MTGAAGGVEPRGLSRPQRVALTECGERARDLSLGELLERAEAHLERARAAHRATPLVNLRMAEAIAGALRRLVAEWDDVAPPARWWVRAAFLYFASDEDAEPDFTSPIGFEDDLEVLNSCLRMARRDDLLLVAEDYDDV